MTCLGRDEAGNETIDAFTVTVTPTERTDKQAIRDSLADLLPTGDDKADAAIAAAIARLDAALDPARWVDGARLDPTTGKGVFDAEKEAIDELSALANPPAAVAAAITDLVAVDAALAQTAIDDAEAAVVDNSDGDPKELGKASRELDRARKEMSAAVQAVEDGKPGQAANRYRQAWFRALQAIDRAMRATE